MPRITLQGCSTQRNGDGRDEYDLCEVFTRHFKYISLFLLFFTFSSSIIRVSPLLCSPCALLVLSTQLSVQRANKSVFPIWLQSRRDKCSQNKKFSRNSWTIKHPSPLSLTLSLFLGPSILIYIHDQCNWWSGQAFLFSAWFKDSLCYILSLSNSDMGIYLRDKRNKRK